MTPRVGLKPELTIRELATLQCVWGERVFYDEKHVHGSDVLVVILSIARHGNTEFPFVWPIHGLFLKELERPRTNEAQYGVSIII